MKGWSNISDGGSHLLSAFRASALRLRRGAGNGAGDGGPLVGLGGDSWMVTRRGRVPSWPGGVSPAFRLLPFGGVGVGGLSNPVSRVSPLGGETVVESSIEVMVGCKSSLEAEGVCGDGHSRFPRFTLVTRECCGEEDGLLFPGVGTSRDFLDVPEACKHAGLDMEVWVTNDEGPGCGATNGNAPAFCESVFSSLDVIWGGITGALRGDPVEPNRELAPPSFNASFSLSRYFL